MANLLSTLRILLGHPTKQDLWNAYYTAKIKKDYRRMRFYFNEIVKMNSRNKVTKIIGTVPGNEVISGGNNFLVLQNNIPETLAKELTMAFKEAAEKTAPGLGFGPLTPKEFLDKRGY